MTDKPWSSMTEHERNAVLATIAGVAVVWRWGAWSGDVFLSCADRSLVESDRAWEWQPCIRVSQAPADFKHGDLYDFQPVIAYTRSLDAMRLVEEAIEKRGLWVQYTLELANLAYSTEDMLADTTGQIAMWRLIRASSTQRAEAAVKLDLPEVRCLAASR